MCQVTHKNPRPDEGMTARDVCCWIVAAIVLVILGMQLTGCTTAPRQDEHQAEQVDWPAVQIALDEARLMAEGFRPIVEARGRGESLDRVMAMLDTAEVAVERRIEQGDAKPADDVAVEAIRGLLDVSGAVIAEWPNPTERAIAQAAHVGLRMTLRAAHRRIEARRHLRPRDDPVDDPPLIDG